MRARKADIPILFEEGKSYGRYMEWGDLDVGWEGWPAGRDSTANHQSNLNKPKSLRYC